jgi:hypothetical protein
MSAASRRLDEVIDTTALIDALILEMADVPAEDYPRVFNETAQIAMESLFRGEAFAEERAQLGMKRFCALIHGLTLDFVDAFQQRRDRMAAAGRA